MSKFKVGDIVKVDEEFYESNVVTSDYLADCVITKLDKMFLDDGVPLLATVERCDGRPFHYIAYDGQKVASEKKTVCVWTTGLNLVESRRF